MFDRFIDKVRMTTLSNVKTNSIEEKIKKRIYPRIMQAAKKGKYYVMFDTYNSNFITLDAWVEKNWTAISTHLTKEGFQCEVEKYKEPVEGKLFCIYWD